MVTFLSTPNRVTSTAFAEDYSERVLRPVFFVKIDFKNPAASPSNPPKPVEESVIFANTSMYDLEFNDGTGTHTYYGAGSVAGLEAIQEGIELQTYGVKLKLFGIPTAMVNRVMTTNYRNKKVTISMGLLDETLTVVTSSIVFIGWIESLSLMHGSTAAVDVSVENAMTDWEKPCNFNYSHADQQSRFPGDNCFKFLAEMVEKEIKWGWNAQ